MRKHIKCRLDVDQKIYTRIPYGQNIGRQR